MAPPAANLFHTESFSINTPIEHKFWALAIFPVGDTVM
jgi:hypothetical protein